jgi:hypothetical protein
VLGIESMPSVQTKLLDTYSINEDFGTKISIDEVAISIFE